MISTRFVTACAICASVLGCAPSAWTRTPPRSEPPDSEVTPLGLYCERWGECFTAVRGVVSSRDDDLVDWYAIEIPDRHCYEDTLRLELTWMSPRPGMKLGLELVDVDVGHRHLKRTKGKVVIEGALPPGTYVVGVKAVSPSAAGTYRVHVRHRSRFCPPRQDIYIPRPEGLVAPRGSGVAAIASVGMSTTDRRDVRADEPTLAIEVAARDAALQVKQGTRATLLDDRGEPVRHGGLTIGEVWSPDGGATYFATATFDEPGWFRRPLELGWSRWFVRFRD